MGNRSGKPSPTLTQTLVPPSEPVTPPKTPIQAAPCPITTPAVSHAEWDECMRQSILTIGSTTVAAIAIGLVVPAADILLLLGTCSGVLWSVKRCRTLMRDGLLSPEQAKALELKKRAEREEKKRQRKMEKEAKQRAAAEQKLLEKQRKVDNTKGSSKQCCENLKKILKQKGVSDDIPCEKLSHENDGPSLNVEKALAIRSHLADSLTPQGRTLQEINYAEGGLGSPKIHIEKPEILSPQHLKTAVVEKHAKPQVQRLNTDTYSSVKLFAPYSRYLSESVILTCDSKECTCNSEKDSNCTCDPKQLSYGEPQQYTLATDAEDEDPPLEDEDPANLVVQQVNPISNDMVELGRNSEVRVSGQGARAGNSMDSNNVVMGERVKHEEQIPTEESEQDEEELEVILSPAFDSIESLNDGSSLELIVDDNEDFDIKIEESQDGFGIEIMKNTVGDEQIEQLKNEVEVFAETYKSESWPFSFSLPSLDKFAKKKNNSFKWPPLTSSIIVKPKKEPTGKCSDGSGAPRENENEHKSCKCGTSNNDCTCP